MKPVAFGVFIFFALFALYFAGLGTYPLVDTDEPVYGQVAKEMAAGAGWLTPHYNGGLWFDKPPLFYWLSGISARLLGPSEFAVRLPSALWGAGLVFLVYAWAVYDFGRRSGVFSGLVMATCLQQIVLARTAVTDMTLAFCLTAALYAYRRWLDAKEGRMAWAGICGVMAGMGLLAKGPVALLLLVAAFFIHLCWTGRLGRLRTRDALLGGISALIVGLPWYGLMYILHGDSFLHGFLISNNLNRFLTPEHQNLAGQWYSYLLNVPVLFAFFFPWSLFLPQALLRAWRSNDGAKLASVWMGLVFIFFSISQTKLVTYIFPLYPAAALFVGHLCDQASKDAGAGRGFRTALGVALVLSPLLTLGLIAIARQEYPGAEHAAFIAGGILILAAACSLGWTQYYRRDPLRSASWIVGAGMAVFSLWSVFGVMPAVADKVSTQHFFRYIVKAPEVRVAELRAYHPSMLFYFGRKPEPLSNISMARQALLRENPMYLFCEAADAEKVAVAGSVQLARSENLVLLANREAALLRKGIQ